jgi:PIN domain nuclease of toxin-antitoxin system
MRLLPDTHILLCHLDNNLQLPEIWKSSIMDRHNLLVVSLVVSMASLWEITIKVVLGQLELLDDLTTVENTLRQQGIDFLPVACCIYCTSCCIYCTY